MGRHSICVISNLTSEFYNGRSSLIKRPEVDSVSNGKENAFEGQTGKVLRFAIIDGSRKVTCMRITHTIALYTP